MHCGKVNPLIIFAFADKGQLFNPSGPVTRVIGPAFPGFDQSLLCAREFWHLYYGHVRHIRPLFLEVQRPHIQVLMQVAEAVGKAFHAKEYRGSCRAKRLNVPKLDFKDGETRGVFLQGVNGLFFCPAKFAWWQDRNVSREMRVVWMQFPSQVFDEMTHGITDVGYDCILWRPR
jgi:hypothetical protein